MSLSHRVGVITVVFLIATVILLFRLDSARQVSGQQLSTITYDLMELSKYDLVHDSELIVVGNVLDQNSAGKLGEIKVGAAESMTRIPGIMNTVEVEKVIKGTYEGERIDVITEGDLSGKIDVEGPAKFHKGEKTILFLYREKGYGGHYTTMGMEQGKYQVDSNGLVEGKLKSNMEYWPSNLTSIADFEANINDILSKPKPKKITEDAAPGDRDLTLEEAKEFFAERNTTGDFVVK